MTSAATPPTLRSFWHDLPREGRLLLSVVVFEFVGTGLVLPFAVVYLHQARHLSLGTTGLLLGLQPLAGLLATAPLGGVIDRIGARLVAIVGLLSAMAGELVLAFASNAAIAALGIALGGIAFGVSWPASNTLIAHIVPTEIRQRYFGVNFSLLNLGIGLGGIVGGLLIDTHHLWTFQAIYLADAASFVPSLFILTVLLRHIPGRAEPDPEMTQGSYREVLRQPAMKTLLLLTFVAAFVGYAQLNTPMPAFATVISQVSTRSLGFAFAANTFVIVFLQLMMLRRIEGRRRTRVIAVMSAVWAVAWFCLGGSGLIPGTWGASWLVATCASVFALGETLLQPTLPAITNDLTTDRLRGRTNAISSVCFQLPAVAAAPLAGWLISHGQASTYIAILLIGCAVVAYLAIVRLEPQLQAAANGVRNNAPDPLFAHLFDSEATLEA